ncbi:hypothetical protein V2J52_02115 [Georgenia sp. MJ173]|uniref:hypothetical protein n=1 Tax=Georgenia sunbinii TaxID=3117728 RepID=UPI002F2612B7
MTWWLWLVLVLGALLLYALIGVSLWRRGRTLLAELRNLEQLTAPLAAAGAGGTEPLAFTPGYLAGEDALDAIREQRRDNITARRARRVRRAENAHARWSHIGLG